MSEDVPPIRRIRLHPEDAARMRWMLLLAGLVLLPTAVRALPIHARPPPPAPLCTVAAYRAPNGDVLCAPVPGATQLAGAEAFLAGVPIDLNTADAQTLALVPGIGPKLSARIVEDRAARGPFSSVGAVERVSGIGPKLGRQIARYAVVR